MTSRHAEHSQLREEASPRTERETGAAPRLKLYRGSWCVYTAKSGSNARSRISTGTANKSEADRFFRNYLDGLSQTVSSESVETMLAGYLANREARNKPGAERLRWAHKQLVRRLGTRPPDTLSEDDFVTYAATRRADGVTDSTARTELQALRAALRWHLGASAPVVLLPARPAPRDRWLTRAEAAKLLDNCGRDYVKLFVLLGLHTAARASSILGLTWDRVNLEQRRINYRDPTLAETRKRRVPVPINDVLYPALVAAKARATTPYVIEFAGKRVVSIRHGVKYAAQRAKLEDVSPHVMRHTAATWMAQEGVSLWMIAGMLGHSDAAMVADTYGHHHPDYMAEAAAALAGPRMEAA